MELIDERDWLRRFITQFLSITRDLVDRARVKLESRPRCSGSQCPHMEVSITLEMIELLETSMATRRNERGPATGTDEVLERFLKFRPPEFRKKLKLNCSLSS
ncbi:hypothetical protein M9H77_13984 [Catharanthus roseus]|uniref:Uncharacterized protein n=1 Tax=Catharanthus roseus TaxID=4058 RepID=A0ACC0BLX8_CATRO|nr:hypothetical protein M9H77_13984 [Catharanthus roseus]